MTDLEKEVAEWRRRIKLVNALAIDLLRIDTELITERIDEYEYIEALDRRVMEWNQMAEEDERRQEGGEDEI